MKLPEAGNYIRFNYDYIIDTREIDGYEITLETNTIARLVKIDYQEYGFGNKFRTKLFFVYKDICIVTIYEDDRSLYTFIPESELSTALYEL